MAATAVPVRSDATSSPSRRELLDRLALLLPADDSFRLWVEELEHARESARHGSLTYGGTLSFGRLTVGEVATRYEGRKR